MKKSEDIFQQVLWNMGKITEFFKKRNSNIIEKLRTNSAKIESEMTKKLGGDLKEIGKGVKEISVQTI